MRNGLIKIFKIITTLPAIPPARFFAVGLVTLLLMLSSCAKDIPPPAPTSEPALTAEPILAKFTTEPEIELDPNLNSPLAALLRFQTNVPTRADVQVTTKDFSHTISINELSTSHSIPVLGLRPDREYQIVVNAFTKESQNSVLSKTLTVSTEPLPDGFPSLNVAKRIEGKVEPGFTLFDIIPEGGNKEFGALIVAVDTYGEIVWYQVGSRYTDVQQLRNGNILFIEGTKVVEMDMLGTRANEWKAVRNPPQSKTHRYVDTGIFHHEIYPLLRGNYLSISVESRIYKDYPTSATDPKAPRRTQNVVGDVIIEFRPNGSIRKQWSLLDLMDPRRIGWDTLGGYWDPFFSKKTRDWSHANAVIHSPRDNAIIVTSRHQDATIKFRRKNGELLWILGPHENWDKKKFGKYLLKPVNDRKYFFPYHSHAPMIMPNGNILMYDNGNYRSSPPDAPLPVNENFSRAVEYRINERKREIELVWEYGEFIEDRIFSGALGDADHLPVKDNVLITHGNIAAADGKLSSAIVEVTHTTPAEEVFRLDVFDETSNPENGWRIYRSARIHDLYGPEAGIKISNLTKITEK